MSKKSIFSSSNPMMGENKYQQTVLDAGMVGQRGETMTIQGGINKTLILMMIMLGTGVVSYMMPNMYFLWGGLIGGAIVMFVTSFKPSRAPMLAPVYAALEGLLVGTVTAFYMHMYDGIVFQAVTITFAILFAMLMIYKAGWIKVTEKFRAGVMMAVGGVMLLYLVNIVLYFFGISIPFLHDGGPMSIGITLVIIVIASMNLLLDFDNFEKGEKLKAPAYMEWYSAMGLLFTLIWLYLEILRLLSYLNRD